MTKEQKGWKILTDRQTDRQPLISVIIPVYNVEKYLDKCVKSVINQTYKNLEIILVDDGSPDNCPQMCDDWAKKDSRITVLHKENDGVSSARNAALDIASGDYIGFVDSDDYIEKIMYEELVFASGNQKFDIVRCNYYENYPNKYEKEIGGDQIKKFDSSIDLKKSILLCEDLYTITNGIYKRSTVGKIRFRKKINIAEDLLFNFDINSVANNKIIINKFLYHYQMNQESVMHTDNPEKFMDIVKVAQIIWNQEIGCVELYDSLCEYYVTALFSSIYYLIKFNYYNDSLYMYVKSLLKNKMNYFRKAKISTRNRFKLILLFCFPNIFKMLVIRKIKNGK